MPKISWKGWKTNSFAYAGEGFNQSVQARSSPAVVSRNAAYDNPERNAQQQHECAENEEAFAYAPVFGDPAHERRGELIRLVNELESGGVGFCALKAAFDTTTAHYHRT